MKPEILQRHEKVLGSIRADSFVWLWINTAVFGLFMYTLFAFYVYFQTSKLEIFQINQVAANTGTALISFSFLLTSLSFFFDRFDKLIIYRKHLGIIGFAYVVAHIVFILVLMPWMFTLGDLINTRLVGFTFGLLATLIFAVMTAISNRYMVTTIGGHIWRGFLRYGGYSALIFSLIHTWQSSSRYWILTKMWPISLIVFVLGVMTILMRLAMAGVMRIKNH
jgi:DMSO/TMAO reductase YedYZ heme-binding membrane subunit